MMNCIRRSFRWHKIVNETEVLIVNIYIGVFFKIHFFNLISEKYFGYDTSNKFHRA